MSDLVYDGRRGHLIDYMMARGWNMTSQSLEQAYAANGFTLPDAELFAAFADARIVYGVLRGEE